MRFYNPYDNLKTDEGKWLKCNFHVHDLSYDDVAVNKLEDIFSMYRGAGYDIIMIANQTEYVDTADAAKAAGMHSYNGQEYAQVDGILLVGMQEFLNGTPQEVIDGAKAQGGFAVACHPHMSPKLVKQMPGKFISPELIQKLQGLSGIEIVNAAVGRKHLPGYQTTLGRTMATDTWDALLSEGKRIWGFGSDDSHDSAEIDRAWTMVYAKSSRLEDVKASVCAGCLYVSTGLYLERFELKDNILNLCANFPYLKEDVWYRLIADGEEIEAVKGKEARFVIPDHVRYARVEAQAADGSSCWLQPVFADSETDEKK